VPRSRVLDLGSGASAGDRTVRLLFRELVAKNLVAHPLLYRSSVDRGVMATASELFEARHFPGVVALVSDALDDAPDCIELRLLRARSQIALRRDLEAQTDLREIIRLDPQCGVAYRLIGELAARRDENESAAIFFREALRLDPDDQEAAEWLQIVEITARPAAVAQKLPAPAAAAGRFRRHESQPRFAKGTQTPDEDRATMPFRGKPAPAQRMATGSSPQLPTLDDPTSQRTKQGAQPLRRPVPHRGAVPELPGFGEYLVTTGILTRERLRAAQAYQRSMKVQLSTAIVTLGLATPQRIEWAAVAHQSQLARER
jgi:tetratricopeptide (TPR) repeat protein